MRPRLLPPSSPLGWTPFLWLVYLGPFITYAVLANDEARDWVVDGVTLAAFFVLYFRGFWVRGRALLHIALALTALGLLTTPGNAGASAFFIYGAAFVGDAVRKPSRAMAWIAGIAASCGLEALLVPLPIWAWVPGVVFPLIIGGSNVHFAEMRRKDRALVDAHRAAEHLATIAERERIARDLHDLLGHTLSVIVIKSELASKLADRDPARAADEIRDVERISRTALQEVRRAIHGYQGERVRDEIDTARAALEAAGVTLATHVAPVALDPDVERALALALREAATNVIRHARAKRCEITLDAAGDQVTLTIADDGVGGDTAEGAGLSGMRSRLAAAGGSLTRDGARGTRLTLTVPAARDRAERAAS